MRKLTKLFCTAFLLLAGFVSANAQDETIDLSADMFYSWDGYGADASSLSVATVDFNVGTELGSGAMVAGTSTVDYLIYADLTGCSKIIFEGTPGMQFRVLLNRQESNSGPLDERNPSIGDNGSAELDLTEFAYVHLNAIKTGWGSPSGTVTAIKLVKPADPLAINKEQLKSALSHAKMQSSFAKTSDSWNALQQAIADGEAALASATDATTLDNAKDAIVAAEAALTLLEGYSELTADMFKKYASVTEPGEGETAYPAYELFVASGLPYGDVNVGELNWADLTEYKTLVVTTVGTVKPRFCLNRLEAGGQQAATMEESKMLDINPNNDFTWSTEKYLTAEDGVYTLDVAAIVADYGFARLHSIKKQGWGDGVIVTGMYLYKEAGEVATDVYTVAGTTDLTGYYWDPSKNAMTLDATGLYKWVASNVTITAEQPAEFKIVKNNSWNEAWPENNWVINTNVTGGEGIFTITITFNAETKDITVNTEKTGDIGSATGEEDPVLVAPEGWTNAITNGNLAGEDVTSYVMKEYPSTDIVPAAIVEGAGKNGSRGILVKAGDDTANENAQAWDSQFWIVLNEAVPSGTKLHVEFDYKASKQAKASTQAHGNPGAYQHWAAIGDVNFKEEWQHFSTDFEVNDAMAKGDNGNGNGTGMLSIAFNLQEEKSAVDYYFDNFGVWYQKPAVIADWTDIIVNGDMEGIDNSCFYVTEQGVGGPFLAPFTEGIGKDGSKAVKVQSADDPSADWDTQFFIRLPYQLPEGTKYRVTFDYKANKNADASTQAHAEPGAYQHWAAIGDVNFTTEWNNFYKEGTVDAAMAKGDNGNGNGNGMQTIAFNLALNKEATEFIFDNVKFEVPTNVIASLTLNPADHPKSYPVDPGFYLVGSMNNWIPSAAYALVANQGAEGEYSLTLNLEAGAEFKVIDVDENQNWTWYRGDGENFSVENAGNYTIYFRPAGYSEWGDYYYVYIQYNGTVGINAVAAEKANAVIYNLNGQRVINAQKGLFIINGKKVVLK